MGPERALAIVTPTFHPEPIGTPLYATDMARWFASRGWSVRVVTAQPFYPRFERYPGYGHRRRHDRLADIEILRVPTIIPSKGRSLLRIINEANFAIQGLLRAPRHRTDVVISISPGVPWAVLVGRALRRPGGTHVALVHDIQSGLAGSLGLAAAPLTPMLRANEVMSLHRADRIAVLTEEMGAALRDMKVRLPIDVVPLWATVEVDPKAWDPPGPPTVQYSGNFGEKQGVGTLLALARTLRTSAPEAQLLLRGQGHRFDALRHEAADLPNVVFEAPVTEAALPAALAKSAVHVIMQAPGSAPYAMPSKAVNALACGCHVIAMAEPASPLARLAREVVELEVVDVGDTTTMSDRVVAQLHRGGSDWRVAAAADARQRFSRDQVMGQLEKLLLSAILLSERGAGRAATAPALDGQRTRPAPARTGQRTRRPTLRAGRWWR